MTVKQAGEYRPKEIEEKILDYWKKQGLAEETLAPRKDAKRFSFLEGPPTANAPPALHHVEVRVFKDLVNRMRYMQGFSVPRKAGWDCHGLPVEVQIEKKLNLASKKEIVEYGVEKFVEECRASVFSHIKEWDKLTRRMAYWIDLKDPYVTMDNDYIESVWWSISQIYKKGLLYEGHKVVPYCPRCGTPLSSHEVALGYKTVKEETVIVSFPVKDEDYSLLAWTTTPWTLLSNLALAVNPQVTYAKIRYRGETFVLAKELAEKRFPEADVLEEIPGEKLVGLEYHPLFNHFNGKLDKPAWRVIAGDFVTTEEGTGIVHIAPAFGEDDYNAGVENDLPLVNPLGEDGKFTDEIPELAGIFAKDADPKIIHILSEQGSLVAQYPYEHEYPYCWRCNTPLLYYAMKSWFIAMTKLRENLLANNREINWFPEHIKDGRFGDWLVNVKDWSLSRNRFWGTPLPIWRCECGETQVLGSRKELSEKAADKVSDDFDLHRPYVDEVKLACKCGKKMSRVEYVIDCWYDSGAATFAQHHYPFENKELFEESFPYDFICEATDQTRGWFYTLLAISTLLFDKSAYKNCVVGGLLLDDAGEKMSKSHNNILDPWELFETVGADAVRLQMCSQAPWNARRFGKDSLNEGVLPLLRTLWNTYEFTTRYMSLDGFDARGGKERDASFKVEDEWILSETDTLIADVTRELEANNYHIAYAQLNEFIVEKLSRWYIKLIRDRLWLEDEDGKINPSKSAAYITLTEVFTRLVALMAPVTPFIAEEIHMNLVGGKSVHLAKWPEPGKTKPELEEAMEIARKIFEAGSFMRQKAGIKLRHPIASVTIVGDDKVKKACEKLSGIIGKQLNAKKVEYVTEVAGTTYAYAPNFKVLGPKYGKDAAKAADAIRNAGAKLKQALDAGRKTKLGKFEVSPDMVAEVKILVPEKYAAGEFTHKDSSGVVYINTERDATLMNEALARDVIRNIQELRKKENLAELDRIKVKITESPKVKAMLGEFEDEVLKEVRGDEITPEKEVSGASFSFEGEEIKVSISF
ncbi:MAG: isoleucine--tRNA ligase [Candidatus Altiarchaeota archaeon]